MNLHNHNPHVAKRGGKAKYPSQVFLRKTFSIRNWAAWGDEIDMAVVVFKERFLCYPEILLASSVTLARIDMAARSLHLENFQDRETGLPPDGVPDSGIGVFSGEEYTLEFCIQEDIESGRFVLIFDPDPDGGEPVPEMDTDEEPAAKRGQNGAEATA